jgi:MoaA/NifB/PqqE/SkfB family radical SAM enzyme
VKKILPPDFVAKLKILYMCGNYGDPMVAKDTLAAFEYLRGEKPAIVLNMHTNASGRDAAWWRRLAKVVDTCTFGVDGLADTNHLYRRGTDWKKVRRAMDAFIGAGGRAEWAFIVFRHNEHQVEEARRLAKEWGFARFVAKRTYRFIDDGKQADRYRVQGRGGAFEYDLEMPTNPRYLNTELVGLDSLVRKHGSYDRYLAETDIDCKAVRSKRIFVSAEGLVMPCCWMARLYRKDAPNGAGELWRLVERLPGGKRALDARERPLREIVEGAFFQDTMPRGWEAGETRIATCARVCGASDAYAAQFADAG